MTLELGYPLLTYVYILDMFLIGLVVYFWLRRRRKARLLEARVAELERLLPECTQNLSRRIHDLQLIVGDR